MNKTEEYSKFAINLISGLEEIKKHECDITTVAAVISLNLKALGYNLSTEEKIMVSGVAKDIIDNAKFGFAQSVYGENSRAYSAVLATTQMAEDKLDKYRNRV